MPTFHRSSRAFLPSAVRLVDHVTRKIATAWTWPWTSYVVPVLYSNQALSHADPDEKFTFTCYYQPFPRSFQGHLCKFWSTWITLEAICEIISGSGDVISMICPLFSCGHVDFGRSSFIVYARPQMLNVRFPARCCQIRLGEAWYQET